MTTRTYRLYATSTATGSNIANVRLQGNGAIIAINLQMSAIGGAGTGSQILEASKLNATQATANDAQQTIAHLALPLSNAGATSMGCCIAPMQLPCNDGDYLYLHLFAAGTAAASGTQSVDVIYAT